MSSETHDRLALYAGAEAAQRSFFFALSGTTTAVTGSSFGLNGLLGADYALNRHFELNAEGNFGAVTFASSDTRVKIMGYLFLVGFSYLW